MVGFTTRHADCRTISKLYPTFFITFDDLFELITKIRFSNDSMVFQVGGFVVGGSLLMCAGALLLVLVLGWIS